MKLLALDIEGTIITGYDYSVEPVAGDRYPAIISTELASILKQFKAAGWKIVTATGTDGIISLIINKNFNVSGVLSLLMPTNQIITMLMT